MADDLQQRGGQDRRRIDVNQDHELHGWSKRFGVSPERLKEAVQAVGTQADRVQEFLKARGEHGATARSGRAGREHGDA